MLDTPYFSLIVPVHNGASFIRANVEEIVRTLEQLGRPFEILVICDGCSDGTAELVRAVNDPRVRVFAYRVNQGKGLAISYGITHATGRLVGWLDADLDIEASVVVSAVREFDKGEVDAVVGSKRHPDSQVSYPLARRVLSFGYQLLVRLLFRINVRDTQVGAKVFRRELLRTVAPLLLIKRYAFDLEVLAVGADFGFDRIRETPIRLGYRFSGTGIDSMAVRRMLVDTLAIGYRIHLRHWYVRQFAALQRRRLEVLAADPDQHVDLPPVAGGNLGTIRSIQTGMH